MVFFLISQLKTLIFIHSPKDITPPANKKLHECRKKQIQTSLYVMWDDHLSCRRGGKNWTKIRVHCVSIDFPCPRKRKIVFFLNLWMMFAVEKALIKRWVKRNPLPNPSSCHSIRVSVIWHRSHWRVSIVLRPTFMNNKVRKSSEKSSEKEKKRAEKKKKKGVELTISRFIGLYAC